MNINWLRYFSSDLALPALMRAPYRHGLQTLPDRPPLARAFIPQKWLLALGLGTLIGLALAAASRRKKS